MNDDDLSKMIVEMVRFYEDKYPNLFVTWKYEIETLGVGPVLNEALREAKRTDDFTLKVKSYWIMLRYCVKDNFKGAKNWLAHNINTSDSKPHILNSARSTSTLFEFLDEKGLTTKELQDIEFENILFGEGKAKEIASVVINDIKKRPRKVEKNANTFSNLYEIFESTSKYKAVMEILVSKTLIHPITYVWKDKKTGYKGLACAIVKDLEAKNYLKSDISMSWDLCKVVCKNSFKVEIKGNKTYYDSTLPPDLKNLIPYSSTLK